MISEIEQGRGYQVVMFFEVADSVKEKPSGMILRYNEMFRKHEDDKPYRYEIKINLQ